MQPLIVRTGWDAKESPANGFHVRAYGFHEVMPPGLIDCHHSLSDWLLIHFHSPAEIILHGNRRRIPEPSFVFWPAGQSPVYGHRTEPWAHSWIHLLGREVGPLLRRCQLVAGRPISAADLLATESAFQAIHHERTFESQPDSRILRNLMENWLLRIQRPPKYPGESSASIFQVKQRLETRPAEALSLHDMAQLAGSSVSHFCAEFRRFFGESPGRYQLHCRMDQARYLLRVRRQRVKEVAATLGYADPFIFSKAFKRATGRTPRAYREQASEPSES